jgi:hypothetical protein
MHRIIKAHLDSFVASRALAAMYCERPELASRYPKAMYAELTDKIFSEDTKEITFYAACLTMYRLSLLVSNSVVPQNMKRFKWHILPIVRAIISGKGVDPLNSKKVEASAGKVITVMAHHGAETTKVFNKAVSICQDLGSVSQDRLKRQAILTEMLAKI